MAHIYHWKHGWIPLDHTAALSKAKGNHQAAASMLEAAHGPNAGIKSRQDVAKAVRDLPNVPTHERDAVRTQLHAAARQHDSTDLVPGAKRSETNWGWEGLPNNAGGSERMSTKDAAEHAFDWVHNGELFDKSNTHQYDAMMGLMDSLEAEGVKTPIVLHHDPETGATHVLDGNHRLAAALALGVKDVPVSWMGEHRPHGYKLPGRHRK